MVKGQAHADILTTYEKDRREHARQLIEIATNLGEQIQPIDPALAAERDAFFEAINQDPVAMEALEQEMFASLTDRHVDLAFCVPGDGDTVTGRLLIQPQVASPAGPMLLDETFGCGFVILGFNCDPHSTLEPGVAGCWQALGTRFVQVTSGSGEGVESDRAVSDQGQALSEWLGSDEPALLLIRPDRFCMVCAKPGDASERFTRAYAMLGAQV